VKSFSPLLIEPFFFVSAVLISIWLLWAVLPFAILVLAIWVVISWVVHRETARSLGFSWRAMVQCVCYWRVIWLVLLVAAAALVGKNLFSGGSLRGGARYFVWCLIQQTVYQSMIFSRLRVAFERKGAAAVISGALFALVHLPNPVLVPATFVWGSCSSLLFLRTPSIPVIAAAQVLLSAIGIAVFPEQWHHGFRIGRAY
jgi:membrane protease YdiL (CAAX protease family)